MMVKQFFREFGSNGGAVWSPDSRRIAFTSDRDGNPQVFVLDLATGVDEQVTHQPLGASGPVWSPDGKSIAFVSERYPQCDMQADSDGCNRHREDSAKSTSVSHARSYDHLFVRHWRDWVDEKRNHLMVVAASGGGKRRSPGRHHYHHCLPPGPSGPSPPRLSPCMFPQPTPIPRWRRLASFAIRVCHPNWTWRR